MPEPAKRVRIRRKDLRGPDEFETIAGDAFVWAREHRAVLVGAGVVLLLLAVVGLLVTRARAGRRQEAATQFYQARAYLLGGNAATAAGQFASLEAHASGTPYGSLASLYQGHALLAQGEAGGAASAYSEYLSTAAAEEYLRQQALLGLGRAKEAAGDVSGALDAYTQAEKLEGPLAPDAAFAAARLHEAQGRTDEARAIYTRLLTEAPDGWMHEQVAAKVPDAAKATDAVDAGNVR
jgi:tetratricopeptide (TPR) repeat protein